MKIRGYPRNMTRRVSSILITCLAIALPLLSIDAQSLGPGAGPCPSDTTQTGYTSISDLNADMNNELARIDIGGDQPGSYFIVLCPQTTFSTEVEALQPALDGATFSCGDSGSVTQQCVFSGGSENIRILDPPIDNYQVSTMNFVGITFEGFTSQSINLGATAPTAAVFMDIIWQVCLRPITILLYVLVCSQHLLLFAIFRISMPRIS
jgi:hypothetical protein